MTETKTVLIWWEKEKSACNPQGWVAATRKLTVSPQIWLSWWHQQLSAAEGSSVHWKEGGKLRIWEDKVCVGITENMLVSTGVQKQALFPDYFWLIISTLSTCLFCHRHIPRICSFHLLSSHAPPSNPPPNLVTWPSHYSGTTTSTMLQKKPQTPRKQRSFIYFTLVPAYLWFFKDAQQETDKYIRLRVISGIFTVLHASVISQRGEKHCRESCDTFPHCQIKNILNPCIYPCHPERENSDENIGNWNLFSSCYS